MLPHQRKEITSGFGKRNRILGVFHYIQSLPKEERLNVLEKICKNDAFVHENREEIEKLLAEDPGTLPSHADHAQDNLVGKVVGGYQILRQLATGGMAMVYLGKDITLDRLSAIKSILPKYFEYEEVQKRFEIEARAIAALSTHPNICDIYQFSKHEDTWFLAMEYIEGVTLMEKIDHETLTLEESLEISLQICDGLSYVHKAQIIHRDIKPSNIMITPSGGVKLLDFGISKMDHSGLTQTGAQVGTLAYMSPEQIAGQPVDQRTDIWSLGIVLHEMITGQRPFLKADASLLEKGNTAKELYRIINNCLEREAINRYANVEHLKKDLEMLLRKGISWENKFSAEENPSTGTSKELLPPLPGDIELPTLPYRRLQGYSREDARIFFGRSKELHYLYKALTEHWTAPIVLIYGESGVGKSSILAAGLQPRLEASHQILYSRREVSIGLSGVMARALETSIEGIAHMWHAIEEQHNQPLIFILDQVEELFTRPLEGAEELDQFLDVINTLFSLRHKRPRGKLILSFRKEWIADIEHQLSEQKLPHDKLFLERLTHRGIMEVVQGPLSNDHYQHRYRLEIEEGLAEMIASNLLKDLQSPVGPTLSILLHEMWERVKNEENPTFTKKLFRDYESKSLSDYLDEQLDAIREWNAKAVESGLVFDILKYCTTDVGTVAPRLRSDLIARYPGREELLENVLQICEAKYLLLSNQHVKSNGESTLVTRLAHDTLAPLVQQRHRNSSYPGQRAERVLQSRISDWEGYDKAVYLDEISLSEVEAGHEGMRAWTPAEERLVTESRKQRQRKRIQQYALYCAGIVLLVSAAWVYQFLNRHAVCSQAGTQSEWCRSCIDHGGSWEAEGDNTDTYCQGATKFALPNIDTDFLILASGTYLREDGVLVTIDDPFYIGRTEVTQAQWYAVMGTNPSYSKGMSIPAERISWDDAQAFIERLNTMNASITFSLPTQSQWEYACLAGTDGPYGFAKDRIDEYAWNEENSGVKVQPVATKLPNPFGLYDMSGNVWEWVTDPHALSDSIAASLAPTTNPDSLLKRVLQGGSFYFGSGTECTTRFWNSPDVQDFHIGFRLVATPVSGN